MRAAACLGIGSIMAALLACAPGPPSPVPAEAPRAAAPAAASAAQPVAPAPAADPPPAATEKVVFSLTGVSANFAPHVVALHRGFFREEGLDVQMPTMRANLVTAAMLAGEVDYSSSTTATVRNALAGTPMRLIGVTVTRSTRRIMAVPPLTTVEQLRGQTIAVNSIGGGPQNSAILGLEQLGINPQTEITWIPAGAGNELFLALQQGAARAGVFGGPEIPRAEAAGFVTVVRLDEIVQLPESGISTSVAKLETQPEQVRRTLRALVRALAYVKTDREGTLPALMQHLDATREDAAEAYDAALPGFGDDGTLSQQSLRYTLDAEKKQLEITDDVPAARVADFAPLYDVLRDLGITPAPTSAR
jgi:ABC-type nitrate/sulfonate/bicarbonate transport system substrate-binding protein